MIVLLLVFFVVLVVRTLVIAFRIRLRSRDDQQAASSGDPTAACRVRYSRQRLQWLHRSQALEP